MLDKDSIQVNESLQRSQSVSSSTAPTNVTEVFERSDQYGQMLLRSYSWAMSSNNITLTLENSGTLVPINLAQSKVFINGVPAAQPSGDCNNPLFNPLSWCTYSFIAPEGTWVSGVAYPLKIVTAAW